MNGQRRFRRFLLLQFVAIIGVLLCGATAFAATVTGTVTNNSGKTGRIFLSVQWSTGGDAGGVGVSIDPAVTTSYAIRGVQDGVGYIVSAFQDTQNSGIHHANDPVGSSAPFTVSGGANVNNISVTLNNPAPVAIQPPFSVGAVAGDAGALITWELNTAPIATSYKVYWSTSPNPGPTNMVGGGSSVDLPSNDSDAYLSGFSNGAVFYFAVTAKLDTTESAPVNANGGVPVTIGAPAGGVTVSGTITTSGATLGANTPLYIALGAGNGPPAYVARVASPTTSQAYTIAGVQPGNYQVYVILDMNNNGLIDLGDLKNTDSNGVPITVGSTNLTGANVALAASAANITLRTNHWKSEFSEGYGLNMEVQSAQKRPVNIAVTGPQLAGPIDIGVSSWGGFSLWTNVAARPTLAPADTYSFAISYSDGTTTGGSPLTAAVTGIVDSFATPTSPVGFIPYPFSGDFVWSAPASPPTPYTYSFWLNVPGFNSDPYGNMPSSTTTVNVPFAYVDGTPYGWTIAVADSFGNSAQNQVSFTATTSPVIASFTPTAGRLGTVVTITGINFNTTPGNNQVNFNGGFTATPTSATATQLVVTVPNGAQSGPLSVTNIGTGKTSAISTVSMTIDSILPTTTITPSPAVPVGGYYASGTVVTVTLAASETAVIYYTTNGSDPIFNGTSCTTSGCLTYSTPFQLTLNSAMVVKALAVDSAGNVEASVKSLNLNVGVSTDTTIDAVSGLPVTYEGLQSAITIGGSVFTVATGAPVTSGNIQFLLDGQNFGAAVAVDGTGTATLNLSAVITAGDHTITSQYIPTGAFVPSTSSNPLAFSVAKAAATVTLGSLSQSYNRTPRAATATTSPVALTVDITYNGSATIPTNAGSYAVVGTINDINYAGSASGTLVISQQTLTVSGATASNRVYDGTTTAAVTSLGTLATVISGDVVTLTGPTTGTFSDKNIGTGKTVTIAGLGLAGADAANYVLSSPTTTATANITVAPLTVTATTQTKVYGSADPALAYSGTLFAGDSFTGALTRATGETVGTYPITQGTLSAGANYAVTYVPANLTITPKPLTITGITANNKVYDGTTAATLNIGSVALVGVEAGDVSNVSLSGTATGTFDTKNVGTSKTVNFSGLSLTGSAAGNYSIATTASTTANITVAPLTVTADAKTKVYGTADPAFTYAASGFVGGDTAGVITGSLTRVAGENVAGGPYQIQQGTLSTVNYAITYVPAALTITKATATVTLGNLNATNDGTGKAVSVVTVPAGLTVDVTYAGSTTAPSAVGSYAVVATINDPNYQGSTTGTLRIYSYGDITGDNTVDARDALELLKVSMHRNAPPSYQGNVIMAPLVNGVPTPGTRTRVDVRDVSLVLDKIVGNW